MGLKAGVSVVFLAALMLGGCGGPPPQKDAAPPQKDAAQMLLEDKSAIADVLIRYATGIDQRDWALFATCFTEDVSLEYASGIGTFKGRDAFTKQFAESHAKLGPTLHKMTNFAITVDGDHAKARSYVDALLMPLNLGGNVRRANGWYEDELVREKDGWKISSRKFFSVQILDTPT